MILRTLLEVGLDGVMQQDFYWKSNERVAPVGSVEAERLLEEGVQELAEQLRVALDVFAEKAPSPTD